MSGDRPSGPWRRGPGKDPSHSAQKGASTGQSPGSRVAPTGGTSLSRSSSSPRTSSTGRCSVLVGRGAGCGGRRAGAGGRSAGGALQYGGTCSCGRWVRSRCASRRGAGYRPAERLGAVTAATAGTQVAGRRVRRVCEVRACARARGCAGGRAGAGGGGGASAPHGRGRAARAGGPARPAAPSGPRPRERVRRRRTDPARPRGAAVQARPRRRDLVPAGPRRVVPGHRRPAQERADGGRSVRRSSSSGSDRQSCRLGGVGSLSLPVGERHGQGQAGRTRVRLGVGAGVLSRWTMSGDRPSGPGDAVPGRGPVALAQKGASTGQSPGSRVAPTCAMSLSRSSSSPRTSSTGRCSVLVGQGAGCGGRSAGAGGRSAGGGLQ